MDELKAETDVPGSPSAMPIRRIMCAYSTLSILSADVPFITDCNGQAKVLP